MSGLLSLPDSILLWRVTSSISTTAEGLTTPVLVFLSDRSLESTVRVASHARGRGKHSRGLVWFPPAFSPQGWATGCTRDVSSCRGLKRGKTYIFRAVVPMGCEAGLETALVSRSDDPEVQRGTHGDTIDPEGWEGRGLEDDDDAVES